MRLSRLTDEHLNDNCNEFIIIIIILIIAASSIQSLDQILMENKFYPIQ